MSVIIYKADVCPPSRAVLAIAEILELQYEAKEISCVTKETMRPEFIKKNPSHTVPVLEEENFILIDSHAIMMYLVSKYGTGARKELYPSDFTSRATIDQMLFLDATKIFPVCKVILVAIIHEKAAGANQKQIEEVNEGYKILESYLENSHYVAGDHLTIADVSIVTTISTLETLVPVDKKYEKLIAWLGRLKNEDWYQKKVVPGLNKLIEIVKDSVKKNRD